MESIRRIVMVNWMTANGYFAGADGNLDWVVPDETQAKAAVQAIPLCDTALFGRRTYELFEKFWSRAEDKRVTCWSGGEKRRRTIPAIRGAFRLLIDYLYMERSATGAAISMRLHAEKTGAHPSCAFSFELGNVKLSSALK